MGAFERRFGRSLYGTAAANWRPRAAVIQASAQLSLADFAMMRLLSVAFFTVH
jgi:hypothetical protein